jgi:hypothetical protein
MLLAAMVAFVLTSATALGADAAPHIHIAFAHGATPPVMGSLRAGALPFSRMTPYTRTRASLGAPRTAGPVRIGAAGEDAVRGSYPVGEKVPIEVAGRTRIPDGLTDETLSEARTSSR